MRSPAPAFDVRTALTAEIRSVQASLAAPLTAKGVHAGRVGLKRARAIARIGRDGAPGLAAVFDESARAAMRLLAETRANAALAAAAREAAKTQGRKAGAALAVAADRIEFAGGAETPSLRETLAGALKDLHALAHVWPEASERQIARAVEAILGRVRRARRRGLASGDPDARHKWRRREKERLYAAEALGADWPRPRQLKRAARVCDALGKERDTLLLLARIETQDLPANAEPAPEAALKALRKRAKHWRRRADKLGRGLARA